MLFGSWSLQVGSSSSEDILMKQALKKMAERIAAWPIIRSTVVHLVYPNVVRCMLQEIRPDEMPDAGVVGAISWKAHSYLVLNEELSSGQNCCQEEWRSDRNTREKILAIVLETIAGNPGDIFEFGVSAGESFLYFVEHCPDRQVYGFDSFEGLPEDWWSRPKGTFAAAAPQLTRTNGHLVKGWFDQSVPEFFSRWTGRIALLHIDCDLYSSTATAFQYAIEFCAPGTVVLFDEYFNYPGFAQHEWRAWRERRAERGIKAKCIAFDGRRAAFQILELPGPRASDESPTIS